MMNALLGEPAMLPGSWPYCIPKQIRKCASKALSSLDLYLAWAAPQYLDEGFAPLSWVPDAPVHSGTNEHAAVHVAAIVDGHASSGLELSPCPSHPLHSPLELCPLEVCLAFIMNERCTRSVPVCWFMWYSMQLTTIQRRDTCPVSI